MYICAISSTTDCGANWHKMNLEEKDLQYKSLDICSTAKSPDDIVKAVIKARNDINYDRVIFPYTVCASRQEACILADKLRPYGKLSMCFNTGWVHFDRTVGDQIAHNYLYMGIVFALNLCMACLFFTHLFWM